MCYILVPALFYLCWLKVRRFCFQRLGQLWQWQKTTCMGINLQKLLHQWENIINLSQSLEGYITELEQIVISKFTRIRVETQSYVLCDYFSCRIFCQHYKDSLKTSGSYKRCLWQEQVIWFWQRSRSPCWQPIRKFGHYSM